MTGGSRIAMQDSLIYKACIGVLIGLVLLGSGFVATCVLAGGLVFFAFWVLIQRSRTIRWLARSFPVATDFIVTIGTFVLMPEGIMAVLSAATVGILTTTYVARLRQKHLKASFIQAEMTSSRGQEVRPS